MMPWYMPALALLGVALVVMSLWQRRTVWRVLALLAVLLLAGAELAALNALRLPPYAGPIAVGRPFPAFEARRAGGTRVTQGDLTGEPHHLPVFFRRRWGPPCKPGPVPLARRHQDFPKRNTRVLVASVEGLDDARKTQADFPHLTVLSDEARGLSEAAALIHPHAAPDGGDTDVPTTFLVDRRGTVRWVYRS